MAIDEITTTAELKRVMLGETRGVVLDFWGTWCQPCRSLRPHLEKLAEDHGARWRVLAVHCDESASLVEAFAVQATPTIVYLRGGDEVARTTGAVTPSSIAETMATL